MIAFIILLISLFSISQTPAYITFTPYEPVIDSPKNFMGKSISSSEYFSGDATLRYEGIDHTVAVIEIRNYAIADDSVGARETIYTLEKRGDTWRITDAKTRWQCARALFDDSWRITPCP